MDGPLTESRGPLGMPAGISPLWVGFSPQSASISKLSTAIRGSDECRVRNMLVNQENSDVLPFSELLK
jgi:hypothetical protein